MQSDSPRFVVVNLLVNATLYNTLLLPYCPAKFSYNPYQRIQGPLKKHRPCVLKQVGNIICRTVGSQEHGSSPKSRSELLEIACT